MEDNRELNAPLIQPAGLYDTDDNSTQATSVTRLGDEADAAAGPKDEADAAAGPTSSSPHQPDRLSGFALAVILFFQAAGGPFGVEPSLRAAGNLYAIIGFAVMPFIWSLPEAVMTYELSSLYPCASGGVRWAEEAFGDWWGLLVGYLGWISGVTCNASYPVLFLSYVHQQFFPQATATEDNLLLHYVILLSITLVLAFVNYRGLDVVGKATIVIFFVAMLPFLLMVIIGIPKGKSEVNLFILQAYTPLLTLTCTQHIAVDPQKWLQTPTGEEEVFDDDSLAHKGWFPDTANLAGIACE